MKPGTWTFMTQRQVDELRLRGDGTSPVMPGFVFVVTRSWVTADGSFSTTMPHKYPNERFKEQIRVLVLEEEDPSCV